jgi:pimeloyl-ACP methyl ester carboxylesterase
MRLLAVLVIAAVLPAGLGCSFSGAPGRKSSLELTDCQLSGSGGVGRAQARCGTLEVPEDHQQPGGKKLSLRVAVIPARAHPRPTPVFFLAGGPGQAATEQYVGALLTLARARQDHDIVLVDQRGTGGSSRLRCEMPAGMADPEALAEDPRLPWLEPCVKSLPADPRHFTTTAFVRDLDLVRQALGYEQIHLVGVSYGTRAALAYLREFPGRARTAVLDGVAPMPLNVGEHMHLTAQRALDLSFARCAATPDCARQFPDLPAELAAVLEKLGRAPPEVKLPHPTTGLPATVKLTGSRFASTVFLYSYSPELMGLLPLFIHTAHATGDYAPVAAQSLFMFEDMEAGISRPLQYSVLCAEDVPFYAPELPKLEGLPERSYLGDSFRTMFRRICERWPHATVPPAFKEPVHSDVPVLLLSGDADPVTPPLFGEMAKRTLPNSVHLTFPGQGHNVALRGCLPSLLGRFFRKGTLQGLDTSCAASVAPQPFFLDFLGHPP